VYGDGYSSVQEKYLLYILLVHPIYLKKTKALLMSFPFTFQMFIRPKRAISKLNYFQSISQYKELHCSEHSNQIAEECVSNEFHFVKMDNVVPSPNVSCEVHQDVGIVKPKIN